MEKIVFKNFILKAKRIEWGYINPMSCLKKHLSTSTVYY